MARVQYARSAEDDLLELWLTIAAENPAAADGVVDQLDEIARLLATQPEMGRARPELGETARPRNIAANCAHEPSGLFPHPALRATFSRRREKEGLVPACGRVHG